MESPPTSPPGALTLQALRLHRSWAFPFIGLAFFVGGLVLMSPLPEGGPRIVPGLFIALLGGTFGLGSHARNTSPRAVSVQLRVDAAGLVIGDEAPIPADEIAESKTLVGEAGEPELVLRLRDGSQRWLRLKPLELGAVLREMGIAAGERRASFALQIPFRDRWLPLVIVLEGLPLVRMLRPSRRLLESLGMWLSISPFLLLLATLLAWLIGAFLRGSVVVGADGFTTRWAFFSRFFPFREVTGLRTVKPWTNRFSPEIVLSLRGRPLRLSARDLPSAEADRGAEARALLDHLTAALARHRAAAPEALDLDAFVAHGPENAAGWLASLDALVQGAETRYRVAAPTTERLADIIRDTAAPAEARVGAATALLRRGDGEGRAAVRVAADACADPDLRDTLLALELAQNDTEFALALRKTCDVR